MPAGPDPYGVRGVGARGREGSEVPRAPARGPMEEGSPAPRARYVCDLHENARRYYRSIEPEGPNELTRLNLFEQVTRRARYSRERATQKAPDRRGRSRCTIWPFSANLCGAPAVFGQSGPRPPSTSEGRARRLRSGVVTTFD